MRINRQTRTRAGFSLVEIMVALVVISVGLIAIVGLIPQGIQASRSAADNTIVATIVHDVFNTMRCQPFTTVNLTAYGFGTYNLKNASLLPAPTAFFDQAGFTPTTPPADNYYKVVLKFQPHATLPLSLVTATVSWPAKSLTVPATPLNTQVFFTQIANYQ
jgi:type IV pilus modification protein PilV